MEGNVDCKLMMECVRANSTPRAIAKRVKSFKLFLLKHPNFMREVALSAYRNNPGLREVRRKYMTTYRPSFTAASSDPEVMEKIVYQLKHCRNGEEVIKYIECEREKSVGVVRSTE
jgi:hypothetical protein